MRATDVTFLVADGALLAGTVREPPTPRGAVVLAGATAVPHRAYGALAEALAWSGLSVLTFDYRGIGGSAVRPVRDDRSTMAEWGRLDLDGALGWMQERHPDLPLLMLGHSVGGQLIGLAKRAETLRGAVLVGSQSGHWRNWDGAARFWACLGSYLLPAIPLALGYLPMAAVGMGENLPGGVARQWARWGRHREYLFVDATTAERERYRRLGFPMRLYHLADDSFAPRAGVEGLLRFYPEARTEVISRAPAELGVPRIGHFGWMRPAFRETLWRELAEWLLDRAGVIAGRIEPRPVETEAGDLAGRAPGVPEGRQCTRPDDRTADHRRQ